jgi:hypothetical protein
MAPLVSSLYDDRANHMVVDPTLIDKAPSLGKVKLKLPGNGVGGVETIPEVATVCERSWLRVDGSFVPTEIKHIAPVDPHISTREEVDKQPVVIRWRGIVHANLVGPRTRRMSRQYPRGDVSKNEG